MTDSAEPQHSTPQRSTSTGAGLWAKAVAFASKMPFASGAVMYAAGFYVMPNAWFQLGVLAWLLWTQRQCGKLDEFLSAFRLDPWLRAVLAYLIGGVIASLWSNQSDLSAFAIFRWVGGGMLLLLYLSMMWRAGQEQGVAQRLGLAVVVAGAAAGVGSLFVFNLFTTDGVIGDRLRNFFVYGGLHPVCAGIMWGFAAVWAACSWNSAAGQPCSRRWMGMLVILLVATLLTLSRGALLAVCMGHIALFAVRGWRKTWRCCALLVLVVMVFQVGSPLLTRVSDWQQEVKARIWTGREVKHLVGGVALTQNPVKELYERGDNGRLDLYKHVLSLVSSTQDRILGKGLWASQEVWRKGVIWAPEHMHSVFLSTYYHLGLCGLVALVLLLGYGLRRCVIAARAGEDVWLILAVYGLMAVTFDGHSMQILLSEPRFESLVLWLPLVIGCAASQRLAASSAPVSRVN